MEYLKKLRQQNVVEYILYMWYFERLARALDSEMALQAFLQSLPQGHPQNHWDLKEIIPPIYHQMVQEGIVKTPTQHLKSVTDLVVRLEQLHQKLLKDPQEEVYEGMMILTLPSLIDLKRKTPGNPGEVELGIIALAGYVTLKQEGKEILPETQKSMERISLWLKVLSEKFAQEEASL